MQVFNVMHDGVFCLCPVFVLLLFDTPVNGTLCLVVLNIPDSLWYNNIGYDHIRLWGTLVYVRVSGCLSVDACSALNTCLSFVVYFCQKAYLERYVYVWQGTITDSDKARHRHRMATTDHLLA